MGKYILKRLVYIVIVFFIVSLLMYALYNLIPGDPAMVEMEPLRKVLKPAEWQRQYLEKRAELGLDDPLIVRYARWMGLIPDVGGTLNGLLQGQFGDSTVYKRPVIDVIKAPMVNTILLNLFSTILTLAITIPLGIYCAVHRRKASDSAIQAVTVVGYSLPSYLVGIVFIYLFAVKLKIFPVGGAKTPGSTYTGFAEFADRMYYMALPILVLVFIGLAGMTRTVRAAIDRHPDAGLYPYRTGKGPEGKRWLFTAMHGAMRCCRFPPPLWAGSSRYSPAARWLSKRPLP